MVSRGRAGRDVRDRSMPPMLFKWEESLPPISGISRSQWLGLASSEPPETARRKRAAIGSSVREVVETAGRSEGEGEAVIGGVEGGATRGWRRGRT